MPKVKDKARKATEKRLIELEKKIEKLYSEGVKDITKEWKKFFRISTAEIKQLEQALKIAQGANDVEKVKTLKALLIDAKKRYTIANRQFRNIMMETAEEITKINQAASAEINSHMVNIYKTNYNAIKSYLDKNHKDLLGIGIRFDIINPHTIAELKAAGITLPQRSVNKAKDVSWNMKKLNSSVLQGIMNGESMPKIAERVKQVVDANDKAAIRTARTMVTSAENKGRLDSYKDLAKQGVVMHKKWLATHDGRTRDWHLDLDEVDVPLDEYFIDGLGNELEYPGDPGAPGETVYNCRCTMVQELIGIRNSDGTIAYF